LSQVRTDLLQNNVILSNEVLTLKLRWRECV